MRGNVLEKSITALSDSVSFRDVNWSEIPASPGVYVVYDTNEVVYVGMAGRNGGETCESDSRITAPGKSSTCSRCTSSWPVSSSFHVIG